MKKKTMKKIEIEIPEGKCAQWVNGVLTLVDEEKPQDVTERIKTFEDACDELGDEHLFVKEYWGVVNINLDIAQDLIAYLKLRIICAALNEGWVANYHNLEQDKWFPWFTYRDGGFVYALAGNSASYSNAYHGVRLAYKTGELAEYAGRQFIDIYQKLLL